MPTTGTYCLCIDNNQSKTIKIGALGEQEFKEGKYITEYDAHVASKLAHVMAGGCLTKPQWVSEQYILDLEREAFLSLCGEEKTIERIWTFIDKGRPVRN